jgi:hypothetical protein
VPGPSEKTQVGGYNRLKGSLPADPFWMEMALVVYEPQELLWNHPGRIWDYY